MGSMSHAAKAGNGLHSVTTLCGGAVGCLDLAVWASPLCGRCDSLDETPHDLAGRMLGRGHQYAVRGRRLSVARNNSRRSLINEVVSAPSAAIRKVGVTSKLQT